MAAPNIVGLSTIVGISTFLSLGTTNPTVLVNNPANSNSVYKINSIVVANTSGAASAKVTVKVHNAAAGAGTSFSIANNVGIASESTLVILDKASSIYLEENRSISVTANTSSYFDVVCSYETIQ